MTFNALLLWPAQAWAARTVREQALLLAAAALLAMAVLWFGIAQPVLGYRASAQARYADAVGEYLDVHDGVARYRRLAGGTQTAAPEGPTLRTLAARSAAQASITLSRVLPDEAGRLNLWIDSVDPAELMTWLETLAAEHGVRAVRVSLDRLGPRTVRAQVLLAPRGTP